MSETIRIITNYFPPETGAAANRMQALALALVQRGYSIEVICPMPSYPFGKIFPEFRKRVVHRSKENGIAITRLIHYPSNSTAKFLRLFSMFSFGIVLFVYLFFKKAPDKTVIQLSPLPIGFTAVLATRIKRKKILLNISDLWPKAGLEMGLLKPGLYYRILEKMERFCYTNASLLIGQSQEILTYASGIAPDKKTLLYRNLNPQSVSEAIKPKTGTKIRLFYAGLIGVAQGFTHLLPRIKLPQNIELHLFGDGPEKAAVVAQIEKTPQCFYHGTLSRTALHKHIVDYDAAFVPLRQRIYGSVPSKIFEYSAMGMPLLYFSKGEGADLVLTHRLGICADNIQALNALLVELSEGKISFPEKSAVFESAKQSFDFDGQIDALIEYMKII